MFMHSQKTSPEKQEVNIIYTAKILFILIRNFSRFYSLSLWSKNMELKDEIIWNISIHSLILLFHSIDNDTY